jgi:SAM-dependent methyltransferase
MTVLAHETAKYDAIWGIDGYGKFSPGETYVPLFLDMARPERGARILDAGCGAGKGAIALAREGFELYLYDLTDAALLPEASALPFRRGPLWERSLGCIVDYVYCCDVLEHIPTAFTMLAVRSMLNVAKHSLFCSIALVPDNYGAWVDEPLHQTVQPFTWWRDALNEVGTVKECRDLLDVGLYLVTP